MQEQHRPTTETLVSPGAGSGIFDEQPTGFRGLATVASGPFAEQVSVANMTVGEIRRQFADRFDIDPASLAILNGNEAAEDTVVRAGEMLTFTHRAGEKGK